MNGLKIGSSKNVLLTLRVPSLLSWLPLRQTRIDTTLSYDKRKANAAFGNFSDFDALSLYVSGQLTF